MLSDNRLEGIRHEAKVMDELVDTMLSHLTKMATLSHGPDLPLSRTLMASGIDRDRARALAVGMEEKIEALRHSMRGPSGIVQTLTAVEHAADLADRECQHARAVSGATSGRHAR